MGVGARRARRREHTGRRSAASSYLASSPPACWPPPPCRRRERVDWPVMGGLKWVRTYHAMVATPLDAGRHRRRPPRCASRCALLSAPARPSSLVMLLFGAVESSWTAVLAVPAAVLTGLAFATPHRPRSRSTRENEQGFSAIFRFVIMPLFLFSGTFFPVTQLPAAAAAGSPTSRRCGTASRCAGAWPSAPSARWPRSATSPCSCAFAGVGLARGLRTSPADAHARDAPRGRSGHLGLVPRVVPPVLFGGRRPRAWSSATPWSTGGSG